MSDKTHTFDWHEEEAKDGRQGTFLSWAFINFAGFTDVGQEVFEDLSDRTEKFTKVELGITVNGVEVDAKGFMERLDQAVDWAVEREAKKLLLRRLPGLDGIYEVLSELESEVKQMVITSAEAAGFEITEDDWRDR